VYYPQQKLVTNSFRNKIFTYPFQMAQQYTVRRAQFSYTFEGGRNCDFGGDFGVPTRFSMVLPMHCTGPHDFPIDNTQYSFAQNSTLVTYTARPKEKRYIVLSFPDIHSVALFFGVMGQTRKFNHKLFPKHKNLNHFGHKPHN